MGSIQKKQVTQIRTEYVRSKQQSDATKIRRRRKLFLRLIVFGVVVVLTVSSMMSVIDNQSVRLSKKQNEKTALNKKLAKMKQSETQLRTQIKRLHDPGYIGEIARRDYLFSKPNETLFTTSNSDKH